MLQKFQKYIAVDFPFLKDKKVLIAISGGVDSVVLTYLLYELHFDISLAHCNFQLRGKESDLDEEFVKNLAQKFDCQFFLKKFNTEEFAKKNKLSTQITARNLRYEWFQQLIEKQHFDYLLTAHHADDNLETFLINLTRGSGLDGFIGIPKINENKLRPLLAFSRKEIIDFAKKNQIDWREDKSNASTKYIRNKIRHQVIPVLKEINPNLAETFSKTSKYLQQSKQILEDRMVDISETILTFEEDCIKIDIQKIQELSKPKAYLYQLLKKYHFTEWDDVFLLLSAQCGKQIFSETHRLIKGRNFLILSKNTTIDVVKNIYLDEDLLELTNPFYLKIERDAKISAENKQTIYLDKDLLKFPLIIKKWSKGDYICPTGMKGTKKISKFFKDAKYSLLQKELAWLLCSADKEIVWVVNERQDRRFKATNSTKNIIKISTLL